MNVCDTVTQRLMISDCGSPARIDFQQSFLTALTHAGEPFLDPHGYPLFK